VLLAGEPAADVAADYGTTEAVISEIIGLRPYCQPPAVRYVRDSDSASSSEGAGSGTG
jgi:hypothetical protein